MLEKSTTKPIFGYYNGCKKKTIIYENLYANIGMDVKKSVIIYKTYM